MIGRFSKSLSYRWRRYHFGLSSSWKALPENHLAIAGQSRELEFPSGEEEIQAHELSLILVEDCYRLGRIREPIETVVDIGGNIGLFTLTALDTFRPKCIHTYEPNPNILPTLVKNTARSCVTVYSEAVGVQEGSLELALNDNSLHTTSVADLAAGRVIAPMVSFREVIQRMEGRIDLLKLDCEGGEWEMLEDAELWQGIKYLTMEYHLWAEPNATLEGLENRLQELGFRVLEVNERDETFGLLLAVRD